MRLFLRRKLVVFSIAVIVTGLSSIVGYQVWHQHTFSYGWSHSCDVGLSFMLQEYAEKHGGWFPRGEASPEASFSLLSRENPQLSEWLRGKTVPERTVREILDRGELLSPETCGWHYVEGLRNDDDSGLALFWDKVGLGHNGQRNADGGHRVAFVNGELRYIPGKEWEQFLEEQKQLLAEIKRPH